MASPGDSIGTNSCAESFAALPSQAIIDIPLPTHANDYRQVITRLKEGDRFRIQGREFVFKGLLGEGELTRVIDVGDGKALRIPSFSLEIGSDSQYHSAMRDFVAIQKDLKATGQDVVNILDHHLPYYIEVEKKDFVFTLGKFLRDPDVPQREKAMGALYRFAEKTWMYHFVGDFGRSNLAFDGEKWFFFDFSNTNIPTSYLADFKNGRNLFSDRKFVENTVGPDYVDRIVPPRILKKINRIIDEKRAEMASKKKWYLRRDQMRGDLPHFLNRLTERPLKPSSDWTITQSDRLGWFDFGKYVNGAYPKISLKILEFIDNWKNYSVYKVQFDDRTGYLYLMKTMNGKAEKNHVRIFRKLPRKNRAVSVGFDYFLFERPLE